MRISDWSSDVCSSDLGRDDVHPSDRREFVHQQQALVLELWIGLRQFARVEVDDLAEEQVHDQPALGQLVRLDADVDRHLLLAQVGQQEVVVARCRVKHRIDPCRSEEHTSELQSLMRISYAVFCLKKKKEQC